MRDGLDPYGSETAAALNNLEMGRLQDHAWLPQKVAEITASVGTSLIEMLGQNLPKEAQVLLSPIVSKVLELGAAKEELNVSEFAYCVANDFQRQGKDISEIRENIRNLNLFIRGALEARSSPSSERVRRFATIVVSGFLRPDDPEEATIEMLRITSVLAETDVYVLCEAASRQTPAPEEDEDGKWRESVFSKWPDVLQAIKTRDISEMNCRSALVRLQAQGLVEAMDPGFGGGRAPYEVMAFGRFYLEYLRNESEGLNEYPPNP